MKLTRKNNWESIYYVNENDDTIFLREYQDIEVKLQDGTVKETRIKYKKRNSGYTEGLHYHRVTSNEYFIELEIMGHIVDIPIEDVELLKW